MNPQTLILQSHTKMASAGYLYADRNDNLARLAGERLQAMVRYICHSDYEHVVNKETAAMDEIVRRVKVNEEVSVVYLRAIEREQELKQEGREEGLKEGREEGLKEGREEGLKEGIKTGREEGLKEGREEGIKTGREEGLKEGIEKGKIDALKKIMKSFNVSAEQAMDSLEIPAANREQYLASLK